MPIRLLGSNDARVEYGDIAELAGISSFSIAFTVTPLDPISGGGRLVHQWGTDNNTHGWLVSWSGGNVQAIVTNGPFSTWYGRITNNTPVVAGQTTRIVITWTSDPSLSMHIWVNGVDCPTDSAVNGTLTTMGNFTSPVTVGHEVEENADGLDGDYSEFALWDEVVPDSFAENYGEGSAIPSEHTSGLILYAPLTDTDTLDDTWGPRTGTGTGVTETPAPPVFLIPFIRVVRGVRPFPFSGSFERKGPRFHVDPVDEAGSPIWCREHRSSRGVPPHPSYLLGRVERLPIRFHFTPPDESGSPIACRGIHKSRGSPPHPSFLLGNITRYPKTWHHEPPPANIWTKDHRISRATPPHLSFLLGRLTRSPGHPNPMYGVEFYEVYEQGYRVADTSRARYELYVGLNESPNLDGSPTATSATLPFSWTPPTPVAPNTLTLHIVVRLRNQYNLQSFNIYETLLTLDSDGGEISGPVSPPFDAAVYDGAALYIRAVAKYNTTVDPDPADTWDVYAEVGRYPIPGTDAALYSGTMSTIGAEAGLAAEVGPFASGDEVYVLIGVRRASDGAVAYAPVVRFVITAYSLTDGQLFGGNTYEQE